MYTFCPLAGRRCCISVRIADNAGFSAGTTRQAPRQREVAQLGCEDS